MDISIDFQTDPPKDLGPCNKVGCTNRAIYYMMFRKRGHKGMGALLSLALCPDCSAKTQVQDVLLPQTFNAVKLALRAANQHVQTPDDLEICRVHFEDESARVLAAARSKR